MGPAFARTHSHYSAVEVELRWQRAWDEAGVFRAPDRADERESAYVFTACPFTSGDAHMGHVRSYTIADAYARYRRARGDAVLFSLGFDSFGLPTELRALAHDMAPAAWVDHCVERMRGQFQRLGFSFDWSRMFVTSDAVMYRWSQWLFLRLYAAGLIYRRAGQVHWCEACETVLARSQVEDESCWRCHGPVRLADREQWYLRTSAYNEENASRLADLDRWNGMALRAQRSLLGRVNGVELTARAADGRELVVFTTHPDALTQARFVAVSPQHPDIDVWLPAEVDEQFRQARRSGWRRSDRDGGDLLDTRTTVAVDGIPRMLPLIVSSAVDFRFGSTALLGIPAVDRGDEALWRQIADHDTGCRIGSLQSAPAARPAVRYAATDFPISRQRRWGAPIPIVHCSTCGPIPLPETALPLHLADVRNEDGSVVQCDCPRCGAAAERERDSLDSHFDATWMEIPITVPPEDRPHAMFEHPGLQRWLPTAACIHGADTGGFILDERVLAKALRDIGVLAHLPTGEPYDGAVMHGMVQFDGRKMSKHLGNSVDPQELVDRVGADAVRLAVVHAASPAKNFTWTDELLTYGTRFVIDLWRYAEPRLREHPDVAGEDLVDLEDPLRRRLASWHDAAVRTITAEYEMLDVHRVADRLLTLVRRMQQLERHMVATRGSLDEHDRAALVSALRTVIRLAAPLVPHLAEELWAMVEEGLVAASPWPRPWEGELAG